MNLKTLVANSLNSLESHPKATKPIPRKNYPPIITTIIRTISSQPPPSPPTSNISTNNDRNVGDTSSNGGHNTSTAGRVSPPKDLQTDAQI